MHVSPTALVECFPKNRSARDGVAAPALKVDKGVAPDTRSDDERRHSDTFVIAVGKDTKRSILAVTAGFAKFCPRPPNNPFTMHIAATEPKTSCHKGRLAGTLSARMSPVTAAERSERVFSLFVI